MSKYAQMNATIQIIALVGEVDRKTAETFFDQAVEDKWTEDLTIIAIHAVDLIAEWKESQNREECDEIQERIARRQREWLGW